MSESNETVFSIDEVIAADVVSYDVIEAYGGKVRIGSLNSDDMLEWIEENDVPEKRKRAGLRLLVKSLVDAEGNRVPADRFEAAAKQFGKKNAVENGKVIAAALKMNGLDRAAKALAALKND